MICPCRRRTTRLLGTLRVRPVAARDEPYARCRPQLPHFFVGRSQRFGHVWQFSDGLVALR